MTMTRTSPISVYTLGTGSIAHDGTNCTFQTKNKCTSLSASSSTNTTTTTKTTRSNTTRTTMWSFFGRNTSEDTNGTSTGQLDPAAPSGAVTYRKDSTVTTTTDEMEDSERSVSDSPPRKSEDSPTIVDDSNEGDCCYDTKTDLSYHSDIEKDGCDRIRNSLTNDEIQELADEYMPLRHYRAEKGDVDKAIAALRLTLQWRKEFQVEKIKRAFEDVGTDSEMADIITKENETGKIYTRGYDKDGRALMYMRPGRENTMNAVNNMVHLVYQLERAVACSGKNGHGKICLVIDYEGFTISKSPPMSTSKKTLEILQRHYCERMYRAYVCNPPFVFRSFWAVIKPFVDPVTKEKICFCVGAKGFGKIVDDMGGPERAHKQLERCASGIDTVREYNSKEYLSQPFHFGFDE